MKAYGGKNYDIEKIKCRDEYQIVAEAYPEAPDNIVLKTDALRRGVIFSQKAMERLQLKNCVEEEGCLIELKEVGSGEQVKLAYEVKTQRTSKIFGLFKKNMNVEAQVDAETGDVIRTNKPWWAFLASEPTE